MTKRFIATIGQGNQIKIFDAETRALYRVIATPGQIKTTPMLVENQVHVQVECDGKSYTYIYGLPGGNVVQIIANG